MDLELFYHPQRSCEGYVFTPVCDSVNWGVSAQVYAGIYTPRTKGRHPPGPEADTPRSDIPGSEERYRATMVEEKLHHSDPIDLI